MARLSPADKLARLLEVSHAWERLRPNCSFYGLTLAQYKRAIQPSLDARTEIADLQKRLRDAIQRRDRADRVSLKTRRAVVLAVVGTRDEGPDGELYEEMGYVRESARRKRQRRKK